MEAITKNAAISKAILELVSVGMGLEAAIDKVLGEDTFARIANEAYEALNGRQG